MGPGDQGLGREGTPSTFTPSFAFKSVNEALSTNLTGTEAGPGLHPARTGQQCPGG